MDHFENPFWWKQADGTSSQNYQNETTRKNHRDSRSKRQKANRREKDDQPESSIFMQQATQAKFRESLIAGASQRGKASRRGKV